MTPEFEEVLRLTEQEQFNHLSAELGRVKSATRHEYVAKGMARSGPYLEALLSAQLAALTIHADDLADSYIRLASKARLLLRPDLEEWLTARVERKLSAKGLLTSLAEEARFVAPGNAKTSDHFNAEAERRVGALRSRTRLRLKRLIAEAKLATPAQLAPPSTLRGLIEERIQQLDQLEAEVRQTPYALGRYIEPLNRWLETSARLFAEKGRPDIGQRLINVGYMGHGDPLLDGQSKMAAHLQFLEDLLKQADRDPAVLQPGPSGKGGGMATDPRRVAVIHGRNSAAKDAVFAFLWALGLSPVEWEQAVRETGKGSPYNREVVEQLFVATQAVLVVLTGDEDVVLRAAFRHKLLGR